MLNQLDDLYLPPDERNLRRLQRKVNEIDSSVRGWVQSVIYVLPAGLSLIEDELYILGLFLARQRRLNVEMDSQIPRETLRDKLVRVLPFPIPAEEGPEITAAAHREVAGRLESDIDRACQFFCADRNIPPVSDEAIDWRVAIRYLAQEVHRLARGVDIRKDYHSSPQRFEIALRARDLAAEIIEKRRHMITTYVPTAKDVKSPATNLQA